MNLNIFSPKNIIFKGRREDRNTVQQLKQDNDYSLTENNQLKINRAIENLSHESDESNIQFLIDVAENLKYGTNINLGKKSKNDWKSKLGNAVSSSLAMSNPVLQDKYKPEVERVFNSSRPLSEDESEILKSRESILSRLDLTQLESVNNPNIRRVHSNLDSFIQSSETPIGQKKYILKRLDYMLSPEYKIHPQLEDKKTKVFAELISDLVVNTEESEIPNTKAINQKHHGMCAAISIARKLMSYEYKPKYVDSVLSELDDTDKVMVFDKTRLGKGVRVPVQKADVDFDLAQKKGYRILDASVTQWMNIGDMYGADNTPKEVYQPFDSVFGVNDDTHSQVLMEDEALSAKHNYYQALLTAKEAIVNFKKFNIRSEMADRIKREDFDKNLKHLQLSNRELKGSLMEIIPDLTKDEVNNLHSNLLNLNKKLSIDIKSAKPQDVKYCFIPNEESEMKDLKIKSYLKDNFGDRVDDKVLDKNVSQIRNSIEISNSLISSLEKKSSLGKKLSFNRSLFSAGAAYRNQAVVSLSDDDYRTDKMIQYNIPDTESILLDNLSKVITHIEKTGDSRYINHFAEVFSLEDADKESVLGLLNSVNTSLTHSLTDGMDYLYSKIGLTDRKQALLDKLLSEKMKVQAGDKTALKDAAFTLGVKDDKQKVLKELTKLENSLMDSSDNKDYINAFNKMGYKNQLQAFADSYNLLFEAFEDPNDETNAALIAIFNEANELPEDADLNLSINRLSSIGEDFNNLSQNVGFIRDAMNILDDEGGVLNSAISSYVVLKNMEKRGDIATNKELTRLKQHFDKVDYIRSQDEFSGRQGKLSDPSLYKFSDEEQATLNKINKSINKMYSTVNKELAVVLPEIRKPLEEHARKIGVDMGDYWVSQTSVGGLSTAQEIKILEQLTDKKYHSTTNLEKAVESIKDGVHSGISGSSVFHNRMGMHAQYIAEISPNADGNDILWHDNTWGASEHENNWVDSEGLIRTDYSDDRGGDLGYITDDKYRNGNYLYNLRYKYGQVSPRSHSNKMLRKLEGVGSSYKFPLIRDVIIPGDDGMVKDLAKEIKDVIFLKDTDSIDSLKKIASNMTRDELLSAYKRNQAAANGYRIKNEYIDDRIESTATNKGIETQEDYDALPDNDLVKVNFEKVALSLSFPDGVSWKKLAKAETVSEVKAFENERYETAKGYFDYSFAKDEKILLAYALDSKSNKSFEIVDAALKNNHIKLNKEKKLEIIRNAAVFEDTDSVKFDGSLKNTIDFMVNKTLKQFDNVVPASEAADRAKQEIRENFTNSLRDFYYFNESDMNNSSVKYKAISKYIDRKYNPKTNEEFVELYRTLQDMTQDEFYKETSDLTNEDIGIKDYTGYEMLRRYKAEDSKTKSTLANMLFQNELLKDITLSETTPYMKYNKLYKQHQGDSYSNVDSKGRPIRTFDDLYRTMDFSLQLFNYKKMFDANKDDAIRKYGLMPAYPHISIISEENFQKKLDYISNTVQEAVSNINISKIVLRGYNLTDKMDKIISNLNDDSPVTVKQYNKIKNLTYDFRNVSGQDTSIRRSLDSCDQILALGPDATGRDYKEAFKGIIEEFGAIKSLNPEKKIRKGIEDNKKVIQLCIGNVMLMDVPERHRSSLRKDFNDWLREIVKPTDYRADIQVAMDDINKLVTKNAMPKKNFRLTKSDYLDRLELFMYDADKYKNAIKMNNSAMNSINSELNENLYNVQFEFVPEEYSEEFSNVVNKLASSQSKLERETVNNVVIQELVRYSNKSAETLMNNDDVNSLLNSIVASNSSNVANNNFSHEYESSLNNIKDITAKFVSGNIEPNYCKAVYQSISDKVDEMFVKDKSIYDLEKVYDTFDKFASNFRDVHYLNDPCNFLQEYLLNCAKDAPYKKDKSYKVIVDSQNTLLKDAILTSKLLEIQTILMQAADTGNEAAIAEKFATFDSGLANPKTGAILPMDSGEAIDYIARSLIVGDDDGTAVMFIDKLGLADKFIKHQNETYKLEDLKDVIDSIVNVVGLSNTKANIISDSVAPLLVADFDFDDKYAEKIELAKKNILDKTDSIEDKTAINETILALDGAKQVIDLEPNLPKVAIVTDAMRVPLQVLTDDTKVKIEELQADLIVVGRIFNLINKLTVPEYSAAYKEKDSFNSMFEEFEKYNDEQLIKINQMSSKYLDVKVDKQ